MSSIKAKGFYFALAASASLASVGTIPAARAACTCLPATLKKTFSEADFKYLGTTSAGFTINIIDDSVYRWAASPVPRVWVDFEPPPFQNTTYYQVCRYSSATNSAISCGTEGSFVSTTSTPVEKEISTFGTHLPSNSDWDIYKVRVSNSSSTPIKPYALPVQLPRGT